MKKAAIISLYGNNNYGNKLQNYAVQQVLKKHNFDVVTIINTPLLNNMDTPQLEILKFYIKGFIKKVIYNVNIHDCVDCKSSKERRKNFLEFNTYINNTRKLFTFKNIEKFKNFDYYFVGSDQVWNPDYGGLSDLYLLTFTDKPKIALSASFGINELPSKYNKKLEKSLLSFQGISVREENAKKIVERITKRNDVEVLIDPTMMLSAKEWDYISKKPENLNCKKYILCYFLGGISESRREKINKLAKEKECELIDLFDEKGEYDSCGPSEFIYLESHAYAVCTDSFHSCIFAILYNIPFIVFDREGKYNDINSRITTLLKKFHLEKQLYDENKAFDLKQYLKVDFRKISEILEVEQENFNKFIDISIHF